MAPEIMGNMGTYRWMAPEMIKEKFYSFVIVLWELTTALLPFQGMTLLQVAFAVAERVQKTGSVGRSIDVTSFRDYEELKSAIECMFGLEGLLTPPPKSSRWKLVYVDYESDVLLVGDDPWEEFVGCVRCIRILSPTEVQQMSEEGMQILNNACIKDLKTSVS